MEPVHENFFWLCAALVADVVVGSDVTVVVVIVTDVVEVVAADVVAADVVIYSW